VRIKLRQWALDEGLIPEGYPTTKPLMDSPEFVERMEEIVSDSVAPALCDECGEVEPDGHCEHGCPSVLIACGVI
jgi:hypothetical protein